MAPYNQNRDSEDCLSYINTLTLLKINYIMNKITYSTGNRSIRRSGNRFPKSLSQISSKIGISLLVLLSITINSLSSELSRGIGINGGSPLSGEGSPRVWNNRIGNLAANLNTASPTGSSAGTPAKTTELKITVEPRDNYAKADSGSNYVFSVSAAGAQNIRYQWQFNGIDLAGETKTSLVLSNPSPLQDGKYRVKISDGKNTIYSREARMGIVTPPVISSAPLSASIELKSAQAALLSAKATATYEDIFPISYYWKTFYPEKNTKQNISNKDSYYFESYSPNKGTAYYLCIASNIAGTTSSAVWQINHLTNATNSYLYPGTLANHLATNTAAYASNKTLSFNGTLLDNFIPDTVNTSNSLSQLKWSAKSWLYGVKGLTATSVGTTGKQAGQGLITLISPIHYLRARHTNSVSTNFSNWIAFLDKNNKVHWRIPIEQLSSDIKNDTIVGILNEPLPEEVEYLPLLPPDYNYLPLNQGTFQGIGMNQDMKAFSLAMTLFVRNNNSNSLGWNPKAAPQLGLALPWNVQLKNGDSSAPVRLLINNQLVLMSHNTSLQAGPDYQSLYDQINQYMKTLSEKYGKPVYQLTTVPLSGNFEKINSLIE